MSGHPDTAAIPGASEFIDRGSLPSGLLLLVGPAGSGKTMYCRQFLVDGLLDGDYCIFISSSLSVRQFKELFANVDSDNLKFVNPSLLSSGRKDVLIKLSGALADVRNATGRNKPVRVAVDSIGHLLLLCGEKPLLKFIADLSATVKQGGATALCALADPNLCSTLGTFAEGVLEIKLAEGKNGSLARSIRLFSIKGLHHRPAWINFEIASNGDLLFGEQSSIAALTCTLCGRTISGSPVMDSNLAFDSKSCVETYRKLAGAYGPSISDTGLPSELFDVSFFFVDIVGLSDPSTSVKKQVQKIQALNSLIGSCDAFKTAPRDKRIVLPTGDGMAIGFLLNPELPLELGIQLHRKLRSYNRGRIEEDQLGVRIGLGSGPVFTVADLNNTQNVWGPGIILARRVMDAGDNGHILLADKLAEELMALKDEYRSIIKPICHVYEIKHGQKITLYSAHSKDFGNSNLPARVPNIQ